MPIRAIRVACCSRVNSRNPKIRQPEKSPKSRISLRLGASRCISMHVESSPPEKARKQPCYGAPVRENLSTQQRRAGVPAQPACSSGFSRSTERGAASIPASRSIAPFASAPAIQQSPFTQHAIRNTSPTETEAPTDRNTEAPSSALRSPLPAPSETRQAPCAGKLFGLFRVGSRPFALFCIRFRTSIRSPKTSCYGAPRAKKKFTLQCRTGFDGASVPRAASVQGSKFKVCASPSFSISACQLCLGGQWSRGPGSSDFSLCFLVSVLSHGQTFSQRPLAASGGRDVPVGGQWRSASCSSANRKNPMLRSAPPVEMKE